MQNSSRLRRFPQQEGALFLIAICGLCLLPILPEFWLFLHGYDDLKTFGPIAYYEAIVSIILWSPALLLPRSVSRWWIIVIGCITALATLVTGFQAVSVGARWDTTAHAAIAETNLLEAKGFVRTFLSFQLALWLGTVISAFAGLVTMAVKARRPKRSIALIGVTAAFLASSYGVEHAIRYGGNPVHRVGVSDTTSLYLFEAGVNSYHPVLRLLETHWNFEATHRYRLEMLRETERHLPELRGATTISGATPPRVMLLVIGESASRRHWSLYGYARETTPELAQLKAELMVFHDTICRTVGTLTEIQGMLSTNDSFLPVFPLFSFAGYRTHWLSAQLDQGPNDVKMSALIQTCQQKKFLDGAYDENLIPLVRRAIEEPGPQLIIVNLFGSHVRYEDRYPTQFSFFHGVDERSYRLATYDNSIRYTDHVLSAMIQLLRNRTEPSCFLYLSDHAEDVYDSDPDHYLFRSDSVATNAMYEIPMIAWVSPEYRRHNSDFVATMIAAETKPFQSLGLYHSLIDLARLRHPIFDPRRSLFSREYTPPDRHVGAVGRIYKSESTTIPVTATPTTESVPHQSSRAGASVFSD